MSLIARFKRDIAKHRGRSAVLGVLFVTMVVLTVKAVIELRGPTIAAASASPGLPLPIAEPPAAAMSGSEVESRINESKKLWQTLREVKPSAVGASVAFAFDASIYPPPPADMSKHSPVADPEPVKMAPVAPLVDLEAVKRARIIEQSRSLVLKTTAVGNGNSKPMAIINQQLLTIGQEILGFEITAIRAREVEFTKEGVTVVVKMPEGQ